MLLCTAILLLSVLHKPHFSTHLNTMQNIQGQHRHDSFVKNIFFLYYHTESGLWDLPGRLKHSLLSIILLQTILSNRQFVLSYIKSTLSSLYILVAGLDLIHLLVLPVLVLNWQPCFALAILPKQSEIANFSWLYDQYFSYNFFA